MKMKRYIISLVVILAFLTLLISSCQGAPTDASMTGEKEGVHVGEVTQDKPLDEEVMVPEGFGGKEIETDSKPEPDLVEETSSVASGSSQESSSQASSTQPDAYTTVVVDNDYGGLNGDYREDIIDPEMEKELLKSEVIVYVMESGGYYHRSGCYYVGGEKRAITLEKALDEGYEWCDICRPPK